MSYIREVIYRDPDNERLPTVTVAQRPDGEQVVLIDMTDSDVTEFTSDEAEALSLSLRGASQEIIAQKMRHTK